MIPLRQIIYRPVLLGMGAIYLLTSGCRREVAVSCPSCTGWEFRADSELYLLGTAPQEESLTTATLTTLFSEVSATETWRDGGYVYLNIYDNERRFVGQLFNDVGKPALNWADGDSTREFY